MLQGHLLTQSERTHNTVPGITKMCGICTIRTVKKVRKNTGKSNTGATRVQETPE